VTIATTTSTLSRVVSSSVVRSSKGPVLMQDYDLEGVGDEEIEGDLYTT
jgi:hypothetical protein